MTRLRCFLGFHRPWYFYGRETFLTWAEIEAGKTKPPLEHIGWHCADCKVKFKRHVHCAGPLHPWWRKLRAWLPQRA